MTGLRWRGKGEILFLGSDHGETRVWAKTFDGDTPQQVTASGPRRISSFAITSDGLVFASGEINTPFELHAADADGDKERPITSVNVDFVAAVDLPAAIDLTATAPDGKTTRFDAIVRIDTPGERHYYLHGGIMQYVLRALKG